MNFRELLCYWFGHKRWTVVGEEKGYRYKQCPRCLAVLVEHVGTPYGGLAQ